MTDPACPQTEALLTRLLGAEDPRASSDLTAAARAHLEVCPACQRAAARAAALEERLQGFAAEIKTAERPRPFRLPAPAAPAAGPARPAEPATFSFPWALVWGPALALLAGLLAWPFLATPRPGAAGRSSVEPLTLAVATDVRVAVGAVRRLDGRPVKAGEALTGANDLFQCLGLARLQFPNGTTVALQGATFQAFPGGLVLKQGRIEVDVPKQRTVFAVTTPVAVLGIRGTRFTVQVAADGTTGIRMDSGLISVTTVRNEEYPLAAGQSATITAEGVWRPGVIAVAEPSAPAAASRPEPLPGPSATGSAAGVLLNE